MVTLALLFGRPGAGKSTIAAAVAEHNATIATADLDVCIPGWMKENFARGVYPTLEQRQEFAKGAGDYVQKFLDQHVPFEGLDKSSEDSPAAPTCLISFSFVNTDLRDYFRTRFPGAVWCLVDTSGPMAAERLATREGHFYKGPKDDSAEWAFAPVDFEHLRLDGAVDVTENARTLVSHIRSFKTE